jgi:hypothetical protein
MRIPQTSPALHKLYEESTEDEGVLPPLGKGFDSGPEKCWRAALKEAKVIEFRRHDLRHTTNVATGDRRCWSPDSSSFR